MEISGHNNDIIMKATVAMFKDKSLEVFGLKTAKIVDIMPTVLPVVMKSQQPVAEMTIKAAQLAKSANSKLTDFVIGSIIAITDKFLPEEYKRKLLEVLNMTQIEEWIREEGKVLGKAEGKAEGKLEAARNALKKGLSIEDIAEITDLPLETVQKLKAELSNYSA